MKICYRIVTDKHLGFEVQIWRTWWPFWIQKWKYGVVNTFDSIESAKEWIEEGCPRKPKNIEVWKECDKTTIK